MTDDVREQLRLLTPEDVCELLQVKIDWLHDACQKGRFPFVKLGRQLRFRPDDVKAVIDGTWKAESPEEDSPPTKRRARTRKAVAS